MTPGDEVGRVVGRSLKNAYAGAHRRKALGASQGKPSGESGSLGKAARERSRVAEDSTKAESTGVPEEVVVARGFVLAGACPHENDRILCDPRDSGLVDDDKHERWDADLEDGVGNGERSGDQRHEEKPNDACKQHPQAC